MSETAERIEDDCFGPRSPEQIHPSHDLESIDDVGHCKVCLGAWIGGYVTLNLSSPCTKVKPKLDPMTGHPVEHGLQDAGPARQKTAWIDARPWTDVTGDGEVPPHMLLEKTPPQNGHDIGKVFESIFKSLDSSGHFEGVGPGGMQAVWDGAQETLTRCGEDRSGD